MKALGSGRRPLPFPIIIGRKYYEEDSPTTLGGSLGDGRIGLSGDFYIVVSGIETPNILRRYCTKCTVRNYDGMARGTRVKYIPVLMGIWR